MNFPEMTEENYENMSPVKAPTEIRTWHPSTTNTKSYSFNQFGRINYFVISYDQYIRVTNKRISEVEATELAHVCSKSTKNVSPSEPSV
jgi:hypothetical protein